MKKIIIILLIFLGLALSPSSEVTLLGGVSQPQFNQKSVVRLQCGLSSGTGVTISQRSITTAAHITITDKKCSVNEYQYSSIRSASYSVSSYIPVLDFAMIAAPNQKNTIPISCEKLVTGQQYWIAGYPQGDKRLKIISATALEKYQDSYSSDTKTNYMHQRQMAGSPIIGMSGGPVIDFRGRALGYLVGMRKANNNIAMIKEYADTPLCR